MTLVPPRSVIVPVRPAWGRRARDALMFAAVMLGAAALVVFLGAASAYWAG